MSPSFPILCAVIAFGAGPLKSACNANTCKYPTNNTITIFEDHVDFPCACVTANTIVVFAAGQNGEHFAAIFGAPNPFSNGDHRVHTESYNSNETIGSDTTGGYKFNACHLEDIRPNCLDPKLFVKPVSNSVTTAPESVALSRGTPSRSVTIKNVSGAPHIVNVKLAGGPPGAFTLSGCGGNVDNGQVCEITVGFSIPGIAAEAVAQVTFDANPAVLASIRISGK